jgi:hypothetical protein
MGGEEFLNLIPEGGHILITSRNHLWETGIDTVPMGVRT